jgi:DNA end-binding protein Ku
MDVRKPELQMARTLVEQLADRWDPSQYTDQYRENLMKIIKAKLRGKAPKLVEAAEPRDAQVVDLMERLRRSLEESGGGASRSAGRKKSGGKRATGASAARGKSKRRRAA